MSDFEPISHDSGDGSPGKAEMTIGEFLASLGITGNGLNFTDQAVSDDYRRYWRSHLLAMIGDPPNFAFLGSADNVALTQLLEAGDPPNFLDLGFQPVIGGASTFGVAGGLDRLDKIRAYVEGNLINFELTDEGVDIRKIIKGIDWKTLSVEKHPRLDIIDPAALIAKLDEMIDFERLFALLPQLNITPVFNDRAKKGDGGDYRDINFDEIM